MIGGQVLDIAGRERRRCDLASFSALHAVKTGALLTAACRMGAIAARAAPTRARRGDRVTAGTSGWRFRSSTTCST